MSGATTIMWLTQNAHLYNTATELLANAMEKIKEIEPSPELLDFYSFKAFLKHAQVLKGEIKEDAKGGAQLHIINGRHGFGDLNVSWTDENGTHAVCKYWDKNADADSLIEFFTALIEEIKNAD